MLKDIEIAHQNKMEDIKEIALKAHIKEEYLECYGRYKAKVDVSFLKEKKEKGKLILVTATNPTKGGEGKSTITIGLADGLRAINKDVIACLREPSMGPVFGLKGGATGGGYAQVMPMEDINLHFTGDMHAITAANNLVSAVLDNSIYQGNPLNIDPKKVTWKRCLDLNDRTLRDVTIAQNKRSNGVERADHFTITVASETMAVLCLAKDLEDFKKRMERCIVAYTYDDKPVTIKDLGIGGSLCVLMREALKPNLVQTLEHTPVLVHGGPFANIAHGCNSIIATKAALKLSDYVVTEAGFGSDLGAEKFLDIKCRTADIKPSAIVLVTTCRALKLNGEVKDDEVSKENVEGVKKGIANLAKHLDSMRQYEVPVIVCLNRFENDSDEEIEVIEKWCKEVKAAFSLCESYKYGSKGSIDLAQKVVKLCEEENNFHYLYDEKMSLEEKMIKIAQKIYGAKDVEFSELAKEKLLDYTKRGYGDLLVCMAKTQNSLTDDAKVFGCPKDFTIHVKDVSLSLGAGFVVAYTGNILTMPGLPAHPNACDIGIDDQGEIYGLF